MYKKLSILFSSGLLVILATLLELGFTRNTLPDQWQWVSTLLLWFVLFVPGILIAVAVVVLQAQDAKKFQYILWLLEALVLSILVSGIEFTLFFAHEATGNPSFFAYYGHVITTPALIGTWCIVALVVIAIQRVQQRKVHIKS